MLAPAPCERVATYELNSGAGTHVRGVEVRAPYKLVIRLTRPDPSFPRWSEPSALITQILDGLPRAQLVN
jgi:MarR-like DNA-binding transcriptional regulator SgrR of sgrS sRNA